MRITAGNVTAFVLLSAGAFMIRPNLEAKAIANLTVPTPTPSLGKPAEDFDQAAAISKLRDQIKGKGNLPAETVFKNIQSFKGFPAGRVLAIMEMGYARSLGVNCTHCHLPDKWESEDKPQKQIARDMASMVGTINGEMLKGIKNLKAPTPTINCTTCHRGQVVPALDLPAMKP